MAQAGGVSDKEIVLGSYSDLSGIGASWERQRECHASALR